VKNAYIEYRVKRTDSALRLSSPHRPFSALSVSVLIR